MTPGEDCPPFIQPGTRPEDSAFAQAFVDQIKPPPWMTVRLQEASISGFGVRATLKSSDIHAERCIGYRMARACDGLGFRRSVARDLASSLHAEWAKGAYASEGGGGLNGEPIADVLSRLGTRGLEPSTILDSQASTLEAERHAFDQPELPNPAARFLELFRRARAGETVRWPALLRGLEQDESDRLGAMLLREFPQRVFPVDYAAVLSKAAGDKAAPPAPSVGRLRRPSPPSDPFADMSPKQLAGLIVIRCASEAAASFGGETPGLFNTAGFQAAWLAVFGDMPTGDYVARLIARDGRIARLSGGCHWLILPPDLRLHAEVPLGSEVPWHERPAR